MAAFAGDLGLASRRDRPVRFTDQGEAWTSTVRAAFYVQDQGSQLIPFAWFKALRQSDGTPFDGGSLARFGYLPNTDAVPSTGLPVGFTLAGSDRGAVVGMTCSACHTRQIIVGDQSYRIDGGPAFADFQSFAVGLDEAVRRVLASDDLFEPFARAVLAADRPAAGAIGKLRDDVALWSRRFHTLIGRSVPLDRPWGPSRLDAIAMIYNHLNALDLGPPPTYLLADNLAVGDAPARYPFLWNASRQDRSQWGGFADGGNDGLALARNLGEVIGVFATFHPGPKTGITPLDRDYLGANSANVAGLAAAEAVVGKLGPPVWPFPVERTLAARGQAIFDRPVAAGGCKACHGVEEGASRPPSAHTWKTTTWDVGTDLRQWQVILRSAQSGSLEGAIVPGVVGPLKATDLSLNILKAAVTGILFELQAAGGPAPGMPGPPAGPVAPLSASQMDGAMRVDDMPAKRDAMQPGAPAAPPGTFVYEARVLQGIWAAAPYLHNGSVPTLAELLKSPSERVKRFQVGPVYDTRDVGLASTQAAAFTLATTGCEDRTSGNSNCGHDYGTRLPPEDKRALIEYLKTL